MRALVVTCRDPFRPANHRSVDVVRRRRSLRNLAPRTRCPVVCQVNGQWISRKAWSRRINDGDSVVFVTLPQGGSSGGGSNPLRIILQIAVALVAPYISTALLGINGAAAIGSLGVSLVTAAIGMVGSMLVNALIPAPKPPQAQQATSLAAPSPTYSIGAQGNQARIGQPIPAIYGRHQVFPDFAAAPYVEYAGHDQYLYQLFCIGQGYYDIEAIRVEDTPIASFPEITYEVVPPGGSVTLFPTSVTTSVEVSGQEALTNVVLGPFVANAAGRPADKLAIDVVASRGLYFANDGGGLTNVSMTYKIEAQLIDDYGSPLAAWFELATETMTGATTTPKRRSHNYAVALGRYQVRLTRTDTKNTSSRYGHELDWAGLRAYHPGSQAYGDVTMVAMKMRASNNLSAQASRKINFIVTRKLPIWNGTSWSAPTATKSIAWAIADICRSAYGAQLPDARIDLSGLLALDTQLAARGDEFNGVFDSQSTIMEALSQVARAGRAVPFMQGGIMHVMRDAAASIPVALFSQRNIVKNSLSLEYVMPTEETTDAVDVTYFDELTWSERTVRAVLPSGTQDRPAKVKVFGITKRQHAWREGMYIASCNRYRRRMVTFSTEMEGFIPSIGDLIAVQHDMPRWGQSGEIVAWNSATKTATLSEPLDWSAGGAHSFAFRRRDGSVAGPYVATAGVDAYHVTISAWALASQHWSDGTGDKNTPDTVSNRERSHFAFGPSNSQYIKCRVLGIKPKSAETVEVSAVVESDYVHTADTGTAPNDTSWQLPSRFTSPVVTGLIARSMPGASEKAIVSWNQAAGADHYLVEQSSGDGNWTRMGDVSASSLSTTALYGADTVFRVAAVGMTIGPWVECAYGILANYMWTNGSSLMWSGVSNAMWRN